MVIDDIAMVTQWKQDSSFKIFIELNVSRKKEDIVVEVYINILKESQSFYSRFHSVKIVSFDCFRA